MQYIITWQESSYERIFNELNNIDHFVQLWSRFARSNPMLLPLLGCPYIVVNSCVVRYETLQQIVWIVVEQRKSLRSCYTICVIYEQTRTHLVDKSLRPKRSFKIKTIEPCVIPMVSTIMITGTYNQLFRI